MKKFFSFALLSLLLVPLGMMAQGTKGNTITFDANNCTMLFSNLASDTEAQYVSCYLRHNQAPIQIINANPKANYNTIAALQEAAGKGNGFFSNDNLANNMAFATGGDYGVEFYNFAGYYNYACFAIIAPKGYRFTEYYMSICSNKYQYSRMQRDNGSKGATIMRYTYTEGTTYQYTPCEGESMKLSSDGSDEEIFTHTLAKGGNILYFRVDYGSTEAFCTHLNKLRLTYVIDDKVKVTIPNTESASGTKVHTGYINLGAMSSSATSGGDHFFYKNNVTDLEDVNIVAEDATSEISVKDGVIEVSKGGTYWIESPAKFRFTGATLNFQQAGGTPTYTYSTTPLSTFENGKSYVLGNGNGNYMGLSNNNGPAGNKTNVEDGLVYTISHHGNGYTLYNETYGYLGLSSTNALQFQSTAFTWSYSNRVFSYSRNGKTYSIYCSKSNQWSAASKYSTKLSFYEVTTTPSGGSDYTAELYGTSATSSVGSTPVTSANTSSKPAELSVTGLNNDGIKFTVTGPAAFTVDLTMLPLDPNLQNLEFDYKPTNGAESGNRVSAAATNFSFNAGETIVIPLAPGVSSPQAVFRDAYNENRSSWYGSASGNGLSQYYLIDSNYENTGSTSNRPSDKVDADQAGTTKVEFSNIKTLTRSGGTYEETNFQKTSAGYSDIILSTTAQTVYIYSADKPEYCIMTAAGKNVNKHIAYTFYDATLKGEEINETPVVAVTPLYTTSLKRNNVKVAQYNNALGKSVSVADDSATDKLHTFYGIKVKSSGNYGYLTSAQICEAIKAKMASDCSGIYSGDVMRTILYVDMSSLKSVSGGASTWTELMLGTGDNCLFFMPSNFSIAQAMPGGGIIAGGNNGTAVTDIVINDQQPFYSPYSFRTSTHVASYKRTQTNDKPTVTKSTLVLPFSVMLNSNGNPKPTTDSEDTNVTFYNLTGVSLYTSNKLEDGTYLDGVAGKITASPVNTGTAVANTPYYVTSSENDAKTSFKIQVQGATFAKTTLGEMTATSGSGNMTAHGSYNGQEKAKEDQVLYWSKDYFWYSVSDYLKTATVKFLPFRAYYTTSASLTANEGKFILMFNETGETDGIEDGLSRQQTAQSVYDLQGRKLSVGSDQLSTLSKGIYIVNGKKIYVK